MLTAFIGLSMRAFGGAQESVPRRRMNVCHVAMREGVKGDRKMERDGRMRCAGGEGGGALRALFSALRALWGNLLKLATINFP